nr:hypothetical protein [Tanacetum cinerariifolium]
GRQRHQHLVSAQQARLGHQKVAGARPGGPRHGAGKCWGAGRPTGARPGHQPAAGRGPAAAAAPRPGRGRGQLVLAVYERFWAHQFLWLPADSPLCGGRRHRPACGAAARAGGRAMDCGRSQSAVPEPAHWQHGTAVFTPLAH